MNLKEVMAALRGTKRKAEDDSIREVAKRIRIEDANFFETEQFKNLFSTICDRMPWDLPTLFFGMRFVSKLWRRLVDDFFKVAKTKGPIDFRSICGCDAPLGASFHRENAVLSPPGVFDPTIKFFFPLGILKKMGWEKDEVVLIYVTQDVHKLLHEEWMIALCLIYGYDDLAMDVFSDKIGRALKDSRARSSCWSNRSFASPYCNCTELESRIERVKEEDFVSRVAKTARTMIRVALWLGATRVLDSVCKTFKDAMFEMKHASTMDDDDAAFSNLVECSYWRNAFEGKEPYKSITWLWRHLGSIYRDYSEDEGEDDYNDPKEYGEDEEISFRSKASLYARLKFYQGLKSIFDKNSKVRGSWLENWSNRKYYWTAQDGKDSYTIVKLPLREDVPAKDHYRLHCFLTNLLCTYFFEFEEGSEIFDHLPTPFKRIADESESIRTIVRYPEIDKTIKTFRKILVEQKFYYTSGTMPFATSGRFYMNRHLKSFFKEFDSNERLRKIWHAPFSVGRSTIEW